MQHFAIAVFCSSPFTGCAPSVCLNVLGTWRRTESPNIRPLRGLAGRGPETARSPVGFCVLKTPKRALCRHLLSMFLFQVFRCSSTFSENWISWAENFFMFNQVSLPWLQHVVWSNQTFYGLIWADRQFCGSQSGQGWSLVASQQGKNWVGWNVLAHSSDMAQGFCVLQWGLVFSQPHCSCCRKKKIQVRKKKQRLCPDSTAGFHSQINAQN